MTVFGEKEAKGLLVGDSPAKAAYFGNELVWGGGGPQPQWQGLRMKALEDGCSVSIEKSGNVQTAQLDYSVDGGLTWLPFVVASTTVRLDAGEEAWFRGLNAALGARNGANFHRFVTSGALEFSGSAMSLLDGTGETSVFQATHALYSVFALTTVADASKMRLPALKATENCYGSMFQECPILSAAPAELPASDFSSGTYAYSFMFKGCASLTKAPAMPDFTGSASSNVHYGMFQDCSSLSSAEVGWTKWPSGGAYSWLRGVKSSGVFKCPAALGTQETISRGGSYCPDGWTVDNN